MKECSNCHVVKDESEFYIDRRIKLKIAYLARCRECTILFNSPYRMTHRDHLNECTRIRRQNNKDAVNKKNRDSYYRNKDSRRRNQKRYEQQIKELSRSDKVLHSKWLLRGCRSRAIVNNIPFAITYKDIPVPDKCPALGIELKRNIGKIDRNSATVDRIIPSLGYIPGNVVVVSLKANSIKNDATAEEILKVGNFYKEIENGGNITAAYTPT